MSSEFTYEERDYHCPIGCGYKATHRAVDQFPDRPCPRCNGARLSEFRDDRVSEVQHSSVDVQHPVRGG